MLYQHSPTGVFYEELVEQEHRLRQSTQRAQILAGFLRFDLNGDYTIDEAEISAARDLYRHYPYGVVSMDVDQVISVEPVLRYDVMPRYAGLLQLKQDGFITLTAEGLYRIDRQFTRWPAGFDGAFSEDFVLATGVEMPPNGSPRTSTVTREGTGECLYEPRGC
ncbi:hypothetical protein [Roseobacter sp. CCS2]|uniref:hypothetical protein n=1 Tax=Roseobacter sp. CCS2 TaxID=391593 RepID=UPI0000F3E06E|nr:hypothetical protein [Roseobacter sp. CCS2]EBA12866.1 hypothetical protein RCCS2_16254 [Roseobacter sp. CCS2]